MGILRIFQAICVDVGLLGDHRWSVDPDQENKNYWLSLHFSNPRERDSAGHLLSGICWGVESGDFVSVVDRNCSVDQSGQAHPGPQDLDPFKSTRADREEIVCEVFPCPGSVCGVSGGRVFYHHPMVNGFLFFGIELRRVVVR